MIEKQTDSQARTISGRAERAQFVEAIICPVWA